MYSTRFKFTALAILTLALLPGARAQAQKTAPSYTFTDLGGLPGLSWVQSKPYAINDDGQIVGNAYTSSLLPIGREIHPVIWTKDSTGKYVITDLGVGTGGNGAALGINSQGEVVGSFPDPTTGGTVSSSGLPPT
jgi:uncharacterized membrane protein